MSLRETYLRYYKSEMNIDEEVILSDYRFVSKCRSFNELQLGENDRAKFEFEIGGLSRDVRQKIVIKDDRELGMDVPFPTLMLPRRLIKHGTEYLAYFTNTEVDEEFPNIGKGIELSSLGVLLPPCSRVEEIDNEAFFYTDERLLDLLRDQLTHLLWANDIKFDRDFNIDLVSGKSLYYILSFEDKEKGFIVKGAKQPTLHVIVNKPDLNDEAKIGKWWYWVDIT